tara:strand:- start:156 stop:431 length:276 start_codon:yes stop_codon:yes gene_type:complete
MKEEERRKKKEERRKRRRRRRSTTKKRKVKERGSEEKNIDWNVSHVFSMFIFLVVFVFCFEKKNFVLRFGTSNNTNKKNRENPWEAHSTAK